MSFKFCISVIHLGRYKLEMLDEDNMVIAGTDGGSAYIMLMLAKWLFEPEHAQYQRDQRASSDQLGDDVIEQLRVENAKNRNSEIKRLRKSK